VTLLSDQELRRRIALELEKFNRKGKAVSQQQAEVGKEEYEKGPIAKAANQSPPPPTGLELLRTPFPPHQISKLPKGTKAQNECASNLKKRCDVCGGWHHPDVIHLDYVGHAALTDRLLEADPAWAWEPLAKGEDGLPRFDPEGGLWIRLTVCGVTRIGYGNAERKSYMDVGSRTKEAIGDALRNAGMRFGAALELWHKGQLHPDEDTDASKDVGVHPSSTALTPERPRGDSEPPKGSARNVTEEAFNALDASAKEVLERKAQDVVAAYAMHGIVKAVDLFQEFNFETEDKLAIWFLFDSELRSSIKREEIRRRTLATERDPV
jgi:hypothetical protein